MRTLIAILVAVPGLIGLSIAAPTTAEAAYSYKPHKVYKPYYASRYYKTRYYRY